MFPLPVPLSLAGNTPGESAIGARTGIDLIAIALVRPPALGATPVAR